MNELSELYLADNMEVDIQGRVPKLIYADCIFEEKDTSWIERWWDVLPMGGIFVIQTDWHSVFALGHYLTTRPDAFMLNHIAWKNEFGNFPKNKFRQSHDDIIIVSKGDDYKFYPERVQVPKVTLSKGLNPSGRTHKLATSVWLDICLVTTSKERVKDKDGKNIRWQKPIALMERICAPYTDEGDIILDLYMGSGTLGVWAKRNNRRFVGIENDYDVFQLAQERILIG